jgi:hypothetical protein
MKSSSQFIKELLDRPPTPVGIAYSVKSMAIRANYINSSIGHIPIVNAYD